MAVPTIRTIADRLQNQFSLINSRFIARQSEENIFIIVFIRLFAVAFKNQKVVYAPSQKAGQQRIQSKHKRIHQTKLVAICDL